MTDDLGPVLLPYQRAWIQADAPLKVMEKSRRTGLTWAEAADNVLTAAADRTAGGQNVYYIAYNFDMTAEYVSACGMWAKAFNVVAGEAQEGFWDGEEADKNIKTFQISFPASGHKIIALSSRPKSLRGRQGTVVIDEAAFHDDLAELLKAALALLIWGGKVRVISTHNGVDNPFNELVTDIRSKRRAGVDQRITFAEAVDQGLYKRVCQRKGEPWTAVGQAKWVAEIYAFYGAGAPEELDCIPSQSGGQYLSRALIEMRMSKDTPVLRLAAPEGMVSWGEAATYLWLTDWITGVLEPVLRAMPEVRSTVFGWDFARSGDLTALQILGEDGGLIRRGRLVLEMARMPFEAQKTVLWHVIRWLAKHRKLRGGAMDAGGNGAHIAEVTWQEFGSIIEQVKFTERFYAENLPAMKAALEDGTLTDLPRDELILADFRAFQVVRGVPRMPDVRSSGPDGQKRHGDVGIATLLAYRASRFDTPLPTIDSTSMAAPVGPAASWANSLGSSRGDPFEAYQ